MDLALARHPPRGPAPPASFRAPSLRVADRPPSQHRLWRPVRDTFVPPRYGEIVRNRIHRVQPAGPRSDRRCRSGEVAGRHRRRRVAFPRGISGGPICALVSSAPVVAAS
jgi:hypothetical protein